MDNSLERHTLPNLTQEELDNLSSPISIKEIEFVLKICLTKKAPGISGAPWLL